MGLDVHTLFGLGRRQDQPSHLHRERGWIPQAARIRRVGHGLGMASRQRREAGRQTEFRDTSQGVNLIEIAFIASHYNTRQYFNKVIT